MANWFGSVLKASRDSARRLGHSLGETASGLTSAAGKTAHGLGDNLGKTASSLGSAVSGTAARLTSAVSQRSFSNEDTLAFFAVLFAVAAVDKQIDEAELQMILSSPEAGKLSEQERQILQTYSYEPPALEESIQALADADAELKFGLIFCLVNLVRINGKMTAAEESAIATAQAAFKINDVQLQAIRDFIQLLADASPEQQEETAAAVKAATERMQSVGIPVKALTYSQGPGTRELEYSDKQFLEKVKSFGLQAGRGLVEQAYVMWYALHAPRTPVTAKLTIAGALAYWILPIDMLPDVLPAVGFTDDFTTIASAMTAVAASITPEIRAKAKAKTETLFDGDEGFNAEAADPAVA